MSSVRRSFAKALERGFSTRFYEIFLSLDPRFRVLFAKTDFERQRGLLEHGIFVLVDFAEGKTLGRMAIQRLGKLHTSTTLRVTPDMYPAWIDSVVRVLAELDDEFSPSLEAEWRAVLQNGIDAMVKAGTPPESQKGRVSERRPGKG